MKVKRFLIHGISSFALLYTSVSFGAGPHGVPSPHVMIPHMMAPAQPHIQQTIPAPQPVIPPAPQPHIEHPMQVSPPLQHISPPLIPTQPSPHFQAPAGKLGASPQVITPFRTQPMPLGQHAPFVGTPLHHNFISPLPSSGGPSIRTIFPSPNLSFFKQPWRTEFQGRHFLERHKFRKQFYPFAFYPFFYPSFYDYQEPYYLSQPIYNEEETPSEQPSLEDSTDTTSSNPSPSTAETNAPEGSSSAMQQYIDQQRRTDLLQQFSQAKGIFNQDQLFTHLGLPKPGAN